MGEAAFVHEAALPEVRMIRLVRISTATLAAFQVLSEPHKRAGVLRVASYNIRKAVGLDWRRNPERILAVLGEIDADVVALQEVDRRFGRRRSALGAAEIAETNTHEIAAISVRPDSIGWHGNAILVKTGSASIVASERLALPVLEPRGAVSAIIDTGSRRLRVIGVHLSLMRRYRLRQLDALRKHVGTDEPLPTVILGDFNEWGRDLSLDGFETTTPGKSFHTAYQIASLDRVLTSKEIAVRASDVHQSSLASIASDHLPIWADLDIVSNREDAS